VPLAIALLLLVWRHVVHDVVERLPRLH